MLCSIWASLLPARTSPCIVSKADQLFLHKTVVFYSTWRSYRFFIAFHQLVRSVLQSNATCMRPSQKAGQPLNINFVNHTMLIGSHGLQSAALTSEPRCCAFKHSCHLHAICITSHLPFIVHNGIGTWSKALGMATTTAGRAMLVAGACIGNFLEFYSFLAYAYFAPMIGEAFFPDSSGLNGLLRTMLVFAAGFIARPVGAIAIGRYAALHGRRRAMMLSFLVMALGLALLAATPPARVVGPWGPLLILLARVLQGFSEGGEIGPVTALLFDAAPSGQGGLYCSLQYLTQLLGSLAAVTVGLLLSLAMTRAQLYEWGWRIPFVLGELIVPVGFALRWLATSPPHASRPAGGTSPPRLAVALIALTVAGGTVSTYLRHFGVSYAISVLHLSPRVGMFANVAGILAGLATVPLGWWLAMRSYHLRSRIGAMMVLTGVLSVPLYRFAITQPGLPSQILLNCVLFALSSLTLVPMWRVMLEALPSASRVVLFGFIYAIMVSFFGGFTPSLVTWLTQKTGDAMMAGYLMALAYGVQAIAWYGLTRFEDRRHI